MASVTTLSFHVCRLYKFIYSLNQTSGEWYTRLSDYLLSLIFYTSKVDTSLFILVMGDVMSFLRMYMDDFLLTRSNLVMFKQLIHLLNSQFKLQDLGFMHYFLGIEFKHTFM